MFDLSTTSLGIIMLVLGGMFLLSVRFALPLAARTRPKSSNQFDSPIDLPIPALDCAVMVIEAGGKVSFANQLTQEWFELSEDEINLESLARRTRPSEAFLGLCAQEGQARFSLDGRLVQGYSYRMPDHPSPAHMLSLQRLQLVGSPDSDTGDEITPLNRSEATPKAYLEIVTELSQAMASNLDLNATIKTILEIIERLIPSDYSEVTIWDAKGESVTPYRLLGLPESDRHVEPMARRDQPKDGYSGELIAQKTPLFIAETEYDSLPHPVARSQLSPRSYLGVPLLVSGKFIGTLELGSSSIKAFTKDDLDVLNLISGQAAIAIQNALIYQEEQKRVQELTGLANLARVSSTYHEGHALIDRLLNAIGALVNVEIMGILTYDESRKALIGQTPFRGLPPEFVELYKCILPEGSPAEEIWLSQAIIHATQVPEDPRLQALGLDDHALASGINETILVPLTSSERNLGYLQVANKVDGTGFHQDDLRLLTIIAGQAALILENALLFNQSKRRAQRAEALRRIASLLSSVATRDEILKWSLNELARLVQADIAAIFLLEETSNDLRLHLPSLVGVPSGANQEFFNLWISDDQLPLTVTGSQKTFFTFDASQDVRILPLYKPLISKLKVRSAIDVPIVVRDRGIGEIMFGSYRVYHFDRTDMQTVITAAGQLAGAIERDTISAQTDQDLLRKAEQLNLMTRLSRELNAARDISHLLKRVYDEAIRTTSADCGTVYLVKNESTDQTEPAILHYVGEEPNIPMGALENKALKSGTSILVPDLGVDNGLNLKPIHPRVRSALLVPVIYGERCQGLIHLHAEKPGHFGTADQEILQVLASQAAIALDHVQRSQEHLRESAHLNQRVEKLTELLQTTKDQPDLADKPAEESDLPETSEKNQTKNFLNSRIEAVMRIAQDIGNTQERSEVLSALGKSLLLRMGMDIVLIAESGQRGPQIIHTSGQFPENINPNALLGPRNPIEKALHSNQKILVPKIADDLTWQNTPLLDKLSAGSFFCLPVQLHESPAFAILGINRTPESAYTEIDTQAFELLAHQIAHAIRNAEMLAESQRRLQEVNHLLEFSRQIVSLDPKSVLLTLANTVRKITLAAETVTVAFWDPEKDGLVPEITTGYPEPKHAKEVFYPVESSLPGKVVKENRPVRIDEVDFPLQYDLPPESLIHYRDATSGRLPLSILILPLSISQLNERDSNPTPSTGVLILENFSETSAFSDEDQTLITSLAHQTALTLENILLYQTSERRTGQIHALTSVSAMMASSLSQESLVTSLLDQMRVVLPFDTGTLWLRERDGLKVQSARGFDDNEERVGISVAIEDSQLFGEMFSTKQPIYVRDVRVDHRFPSAVEYPNQSWLGIPLTTKGEVIGVIALEKKQANDFKDDDLQLGIAFASQAAIAMENASLYKDSQLRALELDQRSQRLALLNRLSTALSATLDLRQVYQITLEEIKQALNCSSAAIVILEKDEEAEKRPTHPSNLDQALLVAELPALGTDLPQPLPHTPVFHRLEQTLGIYSCARPLEEEELASLRTYLRERDSHSLMVTPMFTGEEVHGLLLLHKDKPHHYSQDEVELIRTISNQAAIAIENARLFAETRLLTEDLEHRVEERTEQLVSEHQRNATLLRIITELSASLDLEQVLHRTLKVLNEVAQAEQIRCLFWRPGEPDLIPAAQIHINGSASMVSDESGSGLENRLSNWVMNHRQPILIKNIHDHPLGKHVYSGPAHYQGAIGAPLMVGEEILGALLLFHKSPGHFSEDQLDLVQATAHQIAVTINNADLYNLVRDQAEDLGNMLRNQQIEASRSRAILESIAEGVVVTDASNAITFFNASAEKILDLDRDQILSRSLDHFTGLFGKAARSWMNTIHNWSNDPGAYQPGETYSERLNLEDGRVVSVQLAPVYMRGDFLGTVSIFHDITHQVEVDRLKTDFVATVSHELRTPMTSIKGYVDVLLMGAAGGLSEQQTNFLKIVQENTQRLTILVNDLLDISRIEANRVKLALQPIDLYTLMETILDEFRTRSMEGKNLQFVLNAPSDLPRVFGDPERIRQILASLLDNAYHYTLESGKVTLKARQDGAEVQIDVTDSGIGIPPEEQPHVFERFYRGENQLILETSGTGLGLSIVQHLVGMHGGRIWLESTGIPGEGSTFSFTLPLYQPKD